MTTRNNQEPTLEERFKATIVWLILNGETEKTLELLSRQYGTTVPKIKIGLPKGRKASAYGCYNSKNKTISVMNSDTLKQPFVILHEYYHHLRTTPDSVHRGTEKYADKFAREFIRAYNSSLARTPNKGSQE